MSVATSIDLLPDEAVPQRDLLMDTQAVSERLSSQLGTDGPVSIESCRRDCVSYRVGKRLRVAYRIRAGGKDHHVAASTFRSRSRSERAFKQATENVGSPGPLRAALHDEELNTVFWTFPNDRRLTSLGAIAKPSPELSHHLDFRWTKSVLVDYYPEASAVVRCLDESNAVLAYAKVHAGDEGGRTHRVQRDLVRAARGTQLRLARPLAYSQSHHTLVVEPIVGRSIGSLDGSALIHGLHSYGAALATLHSLPAIDLPPGPRSPLDRLHRKAAGVGAVRPDVDALSTGLVERLGTLWVEAAGPPVMVHGDTNVNNAILVGDRVAFIDFDRAAIGSAGSDIGNFLALLSYFRSLGILSSDAEDHQAAAFRRGYSSVRPLPDPESLDVHIATALVERAFRAVNRVRARALQRVPALLAEAEGLLSTSGAAR